MKIIVRSKYWGSHVQGHTFKPKRAPFKPYSVLLAQIDFQERRKRHRSQWGCCPHHGGRRVLELTESQFLDAHNGKWDLYHSRFRVDHKGNPTHEFYLLPSNQTVIDVKAAVKKDGWQLWGSCQACILRMDLEPLLKPFLDEKKHLGRTVSHAHVFVVMDVAEDKDPPLQSSHARSNRYYFNKQRALYAKEESSCCSAAETVTTATTEDSQDFFPDVCSYITDGSGSNPATMDSDEREGARSPVHPPRHVQCNLQQSEPAFVDEYPAQIATSMHDHTTGINEEDGMDQQHHDHEVRPLSPSQSQFLEPSQEPARATNVGSYLAALTGAPTAIDNFRAQQSMVPPSKPQQAQTQGCWQTQQQDFPVLVDSLQRMHVGETGEAKGWGVASNKPAHSEMERVPAAA